MVAAVALWIAGYAVACWLWPFTACRKCGASGQRRSPSRRNYGRCRRCKGNPERLRLGRRFWSWAAGVKNKAVG